jgi:hypothetical protein
LKGTGRGTHPCQIPKGNILLTNYILIMETVIQSSAMGVMSEYKEGNLSLEDTLISLETERNVLEAVLEKIKNFKQEYSGEIADLAKEYKEGYKGFTFEVRNGARRFSYKGIPEWEDASKTVKDVEGKYKSMFEAKLKGNPHANISEDGEELPLPEVSYGAPSVIVKAKK